MNETTIYASEAPFSLLHSWDGSWALRKFPVRNNPERNCPECNNPETT
jgi:hypothetical protein